MSQKLKWQLLAGATAFATSLVLRPVLKGGWKRVTHTDPPNNPAARDVTWGQAIAWAVVTGVVVGVARVAARRGAATLWARHENKPIPQ